MISISSVRIFTDAEFRIDFSSLGGLLPLFTTRDDTLKKCLLSNFR